VAGPRAVATMRPNATAWGVLHQAPAGASLGITTRGKAGGIGAPPHTSGGASAVGPSSTSMAS
jgi:hypothetical protein